MVKRLAISGKKKTPGQTEKRHTGTINDTVCCNICIHRSECQWVFRIMIVIYSSRFNDQYFIFYKILKTETVY